MVKRLQKDSHYNEFDLDGDGTVSDDEIKRSQDMLEIELREENPKLKKEWLG